MKVAERHLPLEAPLIKVLNAVLEDAEGVAEYVVVKAESGDDDAVIYAAFRSERAAQGASALIRSSLSGFEKSFTVSLVRMSRLPRTADGALDMDVLDEFAETPKAGECLAAAGDFDPTTKEAILDGGALVLSDVAPITLSDALRLASDRPETVGVTFYDAAGEKSFVSYRALFAQARAGAALLVALKKTGHDRIILSTDDRYAFIASFWACQLAGVAVAPFEAGAQGDQAGKNSLRNLIAALGGAPVFSDDPNVISDARAFGAPTRDLSELLTQSSSDETPHPPGAQQTALMLMTSGSTGAPKLVIQSHQAILGYCKGVEAAHGFDDEVVSMNWFPLTHVGGLVMFHIRDVYLRCQQIQAHTAHILSAPLNWLALIQSHRVTNTWAPNFAYSLIAKELKRAPDARFDLSSLRFMLNGGEQIVADQAADFIQATRGLGFRAEAMRPAWGMSETCSGVLYSRSPITRGDAVAVGAPIPGCAVRIVDTEGKVAQTGATGKLEVRGTPVLTEYYNCAEANSEAFTKDGWFRTGDLARIDSDEVTICGRANDTIIVNGLNINSADLERIVESVDGVRATYSAVVAIRNVKDETDQILVIFAPEDGEGERGHSLADQIKTALREEAFVNAKWVRAVTPAEIPKTLIGKIKRAEIRETWRETLTPNRTEKTLGDDVDRAEIMRLAWRPHQPTGTLRNADGPFLAVASNQTARRCLEAAIFDAEAVRMMTDADVVGSFRGFVDKHRRAGPEASPQIVIALAPESEDAREGIKMLDTFVRALTSDIDQALTKITIVACDPASETKGNNAWFECLSSYARSLEAERSDIETRVIHALGEQCGQNLRAALFSGWTSDDLRAESDGISRRCLVPVETRPQRPAVAPGVVVVTGGLGELGVLICRWLASRFQSPLVIVGRSPIDSEGSVEQRRRLQEIQAITRAEYVPWTNAASTISAVRDAVVSVGDGAPLSAFFHLSGVLSYGPLDDRFADRLDAAWVAKADVADAILVLADTPERPTIVMFSSLASLFGGFGVAAHAVANAYLGAVASDLQDRDASVYALDWSVWADIGQSRGKTDPNVARLNGFAPLTEELGLSLLDKCLSQPSGRYAVGVDPRVPNIAWRSVAVRTISAERFTKTSDEQLSSPTHPAQSGNDLEQMIGQIWGRLLDLETVDPSQNFFDLGGNSLLIPKLRNEIAEAFNFDLKPVSIFRYPTIKSLAAHIGEQNLNQGSVSNL